MSQDELFPVEASVSPDASDFVRWLTENAPDVKSPSEFEAKQREAFPGLDLLREARFAAAWNAARPATLRKRAMGRFLHNWFARAFFSRRPAQSMASLPPGDDFQGGYRRVK